MSFVRRSVIARRNASIKVRPETIAYIRGDRSDPHYPQGMCHFWHEYSLDTGHVRADCGYSVPQVCEQLGVDVEEVRAREFPPRPSAWEILQRLEAEEAANGGTRS